MFKGYHYLSLPFKDYLIEHFRYFCEQLLIYCLLLFYYKNLLILIKYYVCFSSGYFCCHIVLIEKYIPMINMSFDIVLRGAEFSHSPIICKTSSLAFLSCMESFSDAVVKSAQCAAPEKSYLMNLGFIINITLYNEKCNQQFYTVWKPVIE